MEENRRPPLPPFSAQREDLIFSIEQTIRSLPPRQLLFVHSFTRAVSRGTPLSWGRFGLRMAVLHPHEAARDFFFEDHGEDEASSGTHSSMPSLVPLWHPRAHWLDETSDAESTNSGPASDLLDRASSTVTCPVAQGPYFRCEVPAALRRHPGDEDDLSSCPSVTDTLSDSLQTDLQSESADQKPFAEGISALSLAGHPSISSSIPQESSGTARCYSCFASA